jgi:hypothetical protein
VTVAYVGRQGARLWDGSVRRRGVDWGDRGPGVGLALRSGDRCRRMRGGEGRAGDWDPRIPGESRKRAAGEGREWQGSRGVDEASCASEARLWGRSDREGTRDSHGQIMSKYKYGRGRFGGGNFGPNLQRSGSETQHTSLFLITMAQPQPIIHPPPHHDHPMPSPSYSSFNPASYTRTFFGSPISWRPGSFGNGNRYFPGSSPSQFLE